MNFNHKENCFDTIRHFAALLVLFSHNYALHGFIEPSFFGIQTLGGLAVIIFFSISGFLITRSYMYSHSNIEYLKKRFLRLFPGLIFCSFLLTYLYCGLFGVDSFFNWMRSFEAFKTFIFYSTTARSELMTVTSNYVTDRFSFYPALNGPLWSLFYEIFDYILVLIVFSVFSKTAKTCLIVIIPCIIIQFILYYFNVPENNIFNEDQKAINFIINDYVYRSTLLSIPFFTAALLYIKSDWFYKNRLTISITSLFLLLIAIINPKLIMFYAVSIPSLILLLGLSFKDKLIKGKFDYSYGIYIYAWPIQQFFANIVKVDFYLSLILSLIFTLLFSSISWHFIEKRFISKGKTRLTKNLN